MKEFEEINIRHRANKYWKVDTIPYQDYDLLEQMVVKQKAQSALRIMQLSFDDFKSKNPNHPSLEQRANIIEAIHHLYIFSDDLFDEGNKHHRFAHSMCADNARLRHDNEQMQKRISKLNIEIDKLKESIQVLYNKEQ